jgi:hypothetical protein
MTRGKTVLGIVMIVMSVVALFVWETYGKERFTGQEIAVLNADVDAGTLITEKMIETADTDLKVSGCLSCVEAKKFVGKETARFIHKGAPLFREDFHEEGMTAKIEEDEYYMPVPKDWVVSIPDTMVKGDRVFFYANGKFITSAVVTFIDEERESFEIVATSSQAIAMNRLTDQGLRMVLAYN